MIQDADLHFSKPWTNPFVPELIPVSINHALSQNGMVGVNILAVEQFLQLAESLLIV